jgi:RNA polymerase sigma factor (sigma-70 family)
VQDACVRALRYFSSLRDGDGRAWFFAIVRNAWYSRIARHAKLTSMTRLNDDRVSTADDALDPEARLLQQTTVAQVREALDQLPVDFREVIVLREIEGMSYKEIASVVQVPIGTVMSRLARGRERLIALLKSETTVEGVL